MIGSNLQEKGMSRVSANSVKSSRSYEEYEVAQSELEKALLSIGESTSRSASTHWTWKGARYKNHRAAGYQLTMLTGWLVSGILSMRLLYIG